MKKVFRAHPLMLFSFIKPFLFVLVLPFIRAGLQYLARGEVEGLLGLEITTFAIVIIYSFIRWLRFKVVCDDKTVAIRSGVIFVRYSEIDISKLSSVQTSRSPLDMIFGSMTFKINTEAGTKNKSDFEFKVGFLKGKALAKMLYSDQTVLKQRFSPIKVAIMAAATSSAFTGMIIGVPIINRAGNLLGIALSDMLLNEINNVSSKIESYFPPIVNTLSLLFLLAYFISFVYSFLKFLNFKLILGEKKLEVRTGFFVKTRTAFKKSAVNNVCIEQTALMLFLKRYTMKVSVGGFGESKSEAQVIIPSGRFGELERDFYLYFPFLEPFGKEIKPKKSLLNESRFLFWPGILLLLILAISITATLIFEDFTRFILFLTFVLLVVVFYFAFLCFLEYKHAKIKLGNNIFAQSIKGLRTRQLYCPKERVGELKLIRYPLDHYYKTCNLRVTVCSETADNILMRHLDYETIKAEIFECFAINEE